MAFGLRTGLRPPARPPVSILAVSVVLGALAAAGQAPLGYWPVTLAALMVLAEILSRRAGVGQLIWTGWAAGTGYFAAALFWIYEPFQVEADIYGWMAPFAVVLMAVGMALFWALAGGIAALGRGRVGRALGLAVGLSATDLLRGYVFTGFPWALVGHVWIDTPVAQVAAFTGPIGLSALTLMVSVLPVMVVPLWRRAGLGMVGLAMVAVCWAFGTARLADPIPARSPEIHVRLVQPNARQEMKWRPEAWQANLDRMLSDSAPGQGGRPDLIVWPETAIPFLLDRAGPLLEDMTMVSAGVPIATGIQRQEGARYYNSLAVIGAGGTVLATYDKWHLVPFGEYVPLADRIAGLGISAFAAQVGLGYSAGPGARLLDLGAAGKVLPLICYEAVFPQDLNAAPGRADWILQITNDAWFGSLSGPYQHLAQARLRAIEQGLPLLRAANTGVSAVIDARGRVLHSLALNTDGVIDAAVPGALPRTLYSRTGDVPATILVLAAGLALLLSGRRKRD